MRAYTCPSDGSSINTSLLIWSTSYILNGGQRSYRKRSGIYICKNIHIELPRPLVLLLLHSLWDEPQHRKLLSHQIVQHYPLPPFHNQSKPIPEKGTWVILEWWSPQSRSHCRPPSIPYILSSTTPTPHLNTGTGAVWGGTGGPPRHPLLSAKKIPIFTPHQCRFPPYVHT